VRTLKRIVVLVAVALVAVLAMRAWESQRGRPLAPWHTFAPDELRADELDAADWDAYLRAEDAAFAAVRRKVTDRLDPDDRVPINRYFDGSPLYPGRFATDWNRSFALDPEGPPAGAVVFLHGLTDSPYSMRHLARRYREHGFVSIAIRLPGHGTVPGGLAKVDWQDWAAAARLAVREAVRRSGPSRPLHVVGYSNGGALALQYALDSLDDARLPRPTRVVLISPMIGVTPFARFAGVAGLPAIFPAFAKAAWLDVVPEFNPFKYNSFPVNAARQTHFVTDVLQRQIDRQAREGRWAALPPILTFQSVVDSTVSTGAVVSALYARLPANGSELVLYDLNRSSNFGPLLRGSAETSLAGLLPPAPRPYRTAIVTNASPAVRDVVERVVEAGAAEERSRALGLSYPAGVFSLSHIALPFPIDDALYGMTPDPSEDFGIRLGAIALRGERGVLAASLDTLLRMSSNPFFTYQVARIEETLAAPAAAPAPTIP
jgi:alpha-beta hydrolase superfamily lysophospholipase